MKEPAPTRIGRGPAVIATTLVVALSTSLACRGRDDLDGRRRIIPGLAETAATVKRPTLADEVVVLDLVAARAGAVVSVKGSLWLAFDGAAAAVHTEGAYRSSWHLGAAVEGRRCAVVDGLGGEIYLPLTEAELMHFGEAGAKLRALVLPAVDNQLVTLLVNETRVGDLRLGGVSWQQAEQSIPAALLRVGENRIRWYFKSAGELAGRRSAAAFGVLTLAPQAAAALDLEAEPPLRIESRELAGTRMTSLALGAGGQLAYYLAVPPRGAEVRFAVGGEGTARLAVQSQAGGAPHELWQQSLEPAFAEQRVSLAEYAGQIVRLELGSDGASFWGRPLVVAPRGGTGIAPEPAEPKPSPPAADIIIVWSVAAWRRDVAEDPALSPEFARLARSSTVFSRAYAAAADSAPSHAAVLTGRYVNAGSIDKGVATLAESLHGAGYATALISGNGFVNDEAGFARGFDFYDNPMRRREPFAARLLWQRAKRYLQKRRDGRVFIYLAAVEPHLPYTPSQESLAAAWGSKYQPFAANRTVGLAESIAKGARLSGEERAFFKALYEAEVRDVDKALGDMLRDLDELGLRSRTALIVTGDVGEEVFDHGRVGHGGSLAREVVEVPLLIALPSAPSAPPGQGSLRPAAVPRNVTGAVSTLDLYATIRELAGIADDPLVPATSVLRDTSERPVFVSLPGKGKSVTVAGHRLIVPLRGERELYALEADPGETANRWGELPVVERYLRNVFSLGVAYEATWSYSRWGTAQRPTDAFAADHGQ